MIKGHNYVWEKVKNVITHVNQLSFELNIFEFFVEIRCDMAYAIHINKVISFPSNFFGL